MPPTTLQPLADSASHHVSDGLLSVLARSRGALDAHLAEPANTLLADELRRALRLSAEVVAALPREEIASAEVMAAREWVRTVAASGVHDCAAEASLPLAATALAAQGWAGLLGACLLLPAWQWPDAPGFKTVPSWLWADYVRYLFATPQGFTEIGQADAYALLYERRLEELVALVEKARDAAAVGAALGAYVQATNFIPLYFSAGSLRRHAELRGRLLKSAFAPRPSPVFKAIPCDGRRLRVGFVNRHFGPQTETYSTLPTFEQLDADRFEVTLFAHRETGLPLEDYCRNHAADFRVLPEDFESQLTTLRDADLDVVVFGTNITAVFHEVMRLALHRVAPLQIVNNSSCITSGLAEIDLYVSGTLTEAAEAPAHFSERLGLLPGPAHAFNYQADQQEAQVTCSRSDFNLPDDAVVFVSAANYFKIIPEMQHTWARLLAAVPGAYLLLHSFGANSESNYSIERFRADFTRVLAANDVDASRLALSTQRLPSRTDVKAVLTLGDVYLDTFPFGSVNSLVDPLELGLPVVTWEGSPFRSRMGSALLRSLDLADLIATSEDAYLAAAVRLASDRRERATWSERIRAKMACTPIFLDPLAASEAFGDLMECAFDELVAVGPKAFRASRAPLRAALPDAARPAMADTADQAQAILRQTPNDPAARHRLGVALLENGRSARAVTYLLAALQGEEANAGLWIDVARALRADGQIAEAVQALEAGLRIDQARLDGWTMFAELAEQLGAFELAAEARGVADQLSASPSTNNERRPHVLLYTDDPGLGGVAQYNHAVLLALVRAGYRVSCVQTRADHPLVTAQAAAGVNHRWLDYHTGEDFARTMRDGTLAEQLFETDRPDLVIFSDCCPLSNLAARQVAFQRGVPYLVVIGFVGAYLAKNFAPHLDLLARQHARAKEIVAVAEENLHLLHRLFRTPATKGTVIHYGRPESYFRPRCTEARERLRAELSLPADAVVAFTAARLTAVKGFDLQLQAIAQLRANVAARHLHFVWAGDGDQRSTLAALLAQHGLDDRVHLLGQRWDVAEWLDAADIFVLPSRMEGMPLCLMEAMAKGLPVIASAVSGIPEELGDTGKLLPDPAADPQKTVAMLAQTLLLWCRDTALRESLGAAARVRAEKMFRESQMTERTLALVASCIGIAPHPINA